MKCNRSHVDESKLMLLGIQPPCSFRNSYHFIISARCGKGEITHTGMLMAARQKGNENLGMQ